MYSLLVSPLASEQTRGVFSIDRGRFLEYTDDAIVTQLSTLSSEAISAIRSWPCVLMQEGRGDEQVHVGQVASIAAKPRELAVNFVPLENSIVMTNDALWKLRRELDIADFEFSRTHWAIKDKAIWPSLALIGLDASEASISRFSNRPLPGASRASLLAAGKAIGEWGHTELDELLLEAGVEKLSAERDLGSRRDRANAIIRFALENPGATTAENALLTAFLVRRSAGEGRFDVVDNTAGTSTPPERGDSVPAQREPRRTPNTVFVVHGQNHRVQADVVAFLGAIGLRPIVLHEQPNMGRHLLTKFIEEAELVTFAVVLMTDDDVGGPLGGAQVPRARQNVILELGYFLSHLGQARVCALITPGLETPSDFDGIVYIRVADSEGWKRELMRELVAADMPVTV